MSPSFIKELSLPKPNPGGGAASAHGALLALAIVEKVVLLELQRGEDFPAGLKRESDVLKTALVSLREDDSRAYLRFAQARSSADGSFLAEAIDGAIECPEMIMKQGIQVLDLISQVGEQCKKHLLSDLHVAAEFALAAVRGSFHIGMANISLLKDEAALAYRKERLTGILDHAIATFGNVANLLDSRAVGK